MIKHGTTRHGTAKHGGAVKMRARIDGGINIGCEVEREAIDGETETFNIRRAESLV